MAELLFGNITVTMLQRVRGSLTYNCKMSTNDEIYKVSCETTTTSFFNVFGRSNHWSRSYMVAKMMRYFACIALIGSIFSYSSAQSQEIPDGTIDVYFQQLSRGGILEGCSLVFTTSARDTANLKGAQVIMNGSIAIRNLQDARLSFTGKLGIKQVDKSNAKWEAPNHFFFSTANGSTAETAKIIESDTDGYRLLIGDAFDKKIWPILTDLIDRPEFTVGFNRKPDGQDVYSLVNMTLSLKNKADGSIGIINNPQTE